MTEEKVEKLNLKDPSKQNSKANPEEKYPWHLLVRTIILLNAFLGKF